MRYFSDALDILMPFLAPFLIAGTITLIVITLSRWTTIRAFNLGLTVLMWLLVLLGGVITLFIELLIGLSVSAVAGGLATAMAGHDLGRGLLLIQFPVLTLVGCLVACALGAATGTLQWLAFRRFLPDVPVQRWMWLNIIPWTVGLMVSLLIGVILAALVYSIDFRLGLFLGAMVFGTRTSIKVARLSENAFPDRKTNYRQHKETMS